MMIEQLTTDQWSRRLYDKMVKPGNHVNFLTVEEGVQRIGKGGFAFHVEEDSAYAIISTTFSETAICELRHVPMLSSQELFIITQKNSPYLDAINTCLQCLAERGIMNREEITWRAIKPECLRTTSVKQVTLGEFYPALLLVIGGIASSLIIFIIEVIIYYRKKITLTKAIELKKVFTKITE